MQEGEGTIPFPGSQEAVFAPDDPNRVIRSLWIGELSPLERMCMESFVRAGHEFQVFMYEPATDVPAGVVVRDAAEIMPATRIVCNQLGQGKGSFAAFADLFRYQMLYDLGGWWVDMDVFCLRPFTFDAPYVLGAEDKPVANGVIKAPRASELMARTCGHARQIDLSTVLWNETGDILGTTVADLRLLRYVLPPETFSPIVWHEIPSYVRGKQRFVRDERSYAVHLYHEMWRRKKLDKRACYGPNSVVEILKRHAGIPAGHQPAAGWSRWLPWRRAG